MQKTNKNLNDPLFLCIFLASDLGDIWFSQHHTAHHLKSSFVTRGFKTILSFGKRKQSLNLMCREGGHFLNWPRWSFQYVSNFMDPNFSGIEDKFLHSVHIFISCALCWMPWMFNIFNRGHATCELAKPPKKLYYSHFQLSKSYFKIF